MRTALFIVFSAFTFGCSRSQPPREGATPASASASPVAATSAATASPTVPSAAPEAATLSIPSSASTITITSSSLVNRGRVPTKHTCDGDDKSPPLTFSGVPEGAKTLALIVDDPDAPDPAKPERTWTHWLVYDLSAKTKSLLENAGKRGAGGRAGKNDWGAKGYRGPCPPIGRHRYFFKVFALDTELGDLHEPNRADLLKAMEGHVVGQGELVALYEKGE